MPLDWPRFVQTVRDHQRFLLTTHIRPDCDALGSCLGMAGILERMGKQVQIVNGQATPPNLAFIDPAHRIKAIGLDVQPADLLAGFDLLMVLDTSAWAQLGPMGEILRATSAKKIVLDHHESGDDLGAEQFKDATKEATGRLVVEAAEHLNVPLDAELARPLFAALATDTGWFRFSSTRPDTFRIAARLTDAGAVPAELYHSLYENNTLARTKLIGRILARTEAELDGKLVYTAALIEDFRETGALPTDTEDVINLTLQIGTAEVAIIMVEQASGGFKVSFRSRSAVDCSKLAEQFGGGGHKAAAGAFINEPLDAARTKLLAAAREAMRRLRGS